VSSVIATVLMVALVIVLAVAGGAFYFETANEATQEPAPTAAFEWTQNGNSLTITHQGGDQVASDQVTIMVDGSEVAWSDVASSGPITAGTAATLTVTGTTDVTVRWARPGSDDTAVLAQRTIDAPGTATFSGSNEGIRSTKDDKSNLGFGDKRLDAAGYSPAGQLRIAPYAGGGQQLQVRENNNPLTSAGSGITPGTHTFTVVYDGSTLKLTVNGQTVSTTAVDVEEDAITIQVKKADADVTTASVSNLQLDGASVGSPDSFSVSSKDEKSLLLEGGDVTDGFTLTGEFTFDDSGGGVKSEGVIIRFDFA
jgi:FlaG/FlaF family flagellin (archaellin)